MVWSNKFSNLDVLKVNEAARDEIVRYTKNENHQNSFDNSIKNHINVPETWSKVLWSDLEPLQPGNKFCAINLVWLQSGYEPAGVVAKTLYKHWIDGGVPRAEGVGRITLE